MRKALHFNSSLIKGYKSSVKLHMHVAKLIYRVLHTHFLNGAIKKQRKIKYMQLPPTSQYKILHNC